MKNKRAYGAEGERLACEHLTAQGLFILEKNFRAGRIGEIDVIAVDAGTICFIEVKRRSGLGFGTPGEAVTPRKQQTIRTVANCWLMRAGDWNRPVRFDVVELLDEQGSTRIHHIRNAF